MLSLLLLLSTTVFRHYRCRHFLVAVVFVRGHDDEECFEWRTSVLVANNHDDTEFRGEKMCRHWTRCDVYDRIPRGGLDCFEMVPLLC